MTQKATLEFSGDVAVEHSLGERSPSPSFAGLLSGPPRRTGRSETRACLGAPLWVTSLQKPGVFEVVPTKNVSRFGIQMVTQEFWEPAELVLVSSPPGFCVQGSVVYCKKFPSDDYMLGIRLDGPVEHWIEELGLGSPDERQTYASISGQVGRDRSLAGCSLSATVLR
jgi:hypothetical protein